VETERYARDYIQDLKRLLDAVDMETVDRIVEALHAAWRNGKRVLLMGNGGSSSSVSHIVNDLQKNIHLESGRPLRTLCLSDCTPLMMAWANDTTWDNVFAPQVECWAEPGDVVIGVSGSGNSMNVINGIAAANRAGAITFGLAGYAGGKLKATAQHCIVVPSDNMQRIEDVHMVLLHILFSSLQERTRRYAEPHADTDIRHVRISPE
jgi:D-sedoheptulose 7-phosphate isomerase